MKAKTIEEPCELTIYLGSGVVSTRQFTSIDTALKRMEQYGKVSIDERKDFEIFGKAIDKGCGTMFKIRKLF